MSARVLVLGAGGAASNGYARALKVAGGYHLVGANANPDDLLLSECDENHLIAHSIDWAQWCKDIVALVQKAKPLFVHAQNDAEVENLAEIRATVNSLGAKTYLPQLGVIKVCRDKWRSYKAFEQADLPVPTTYLPEDPGWTLLPEMWLRPRIGAGGQRSLRTTSAELADEWLSHNDGWKTFTVAECLTAETVTVQALYWRGQLVCSQQRTRASWANAGSSATGVSGSTGVGVTTSDKPADDVAERAIRAVDLWPHGLYGVDMARDKDGWPCPTEINIGRFFTTASEFYAQAGFNMADLYTRIGLEQGWDPKPPVVNPIKDGKRWLRVMDRAPLLS